MIKPTASEKRRDDPKYRLRDNIRILVQMSLERNGGKRGKELLRDCLPFTDVELIEHIEKSFEPWMSWQNYAQIKTGIKCWNDNDPTTWTWQLDHIISHAFKYQSLTDQTFKDCWMLSNLRPISVKQKQINNRKTKIKPTERICKDCHETKNIDQFPLKKGHDGVFRHKLTCDICVKAKRTEQNKEYWQENKIEIQEANHQWYEDHKDQIKIRSAENKKKNKAKRNAKAKERRKNDPAFVLRANISSAIWKALVKNQGSKKRKSILNCLPYSIEELKQHLESKFEDWMTWNNYGRYDVITWDNNDKTTWKWQIDHITPQIKLPFASMEEPNFLICWSLDNLQPLNAKDNIIKGALLNKPRNKVKCPVIQ